MKPVHIPYIQKASLQMRVLSWIPKQGKCERFFLIPCFHLFSEITFTVSKRARICEGFPTLFTYTGFLSSVSPLMLSYRTRIYEDFSTYFAFIPFLSSVDIFMDLQITRIYEGFATLLTYIVSCQCESLHSCFRTSQGKAKYFPQNLPLHGPSPVCTIMCHLKFP
jgi:hypothetical protein